MLATDRAPRALAPDARPEGRGRPVAGLACQEMFEALLAWEWQDPELGTVHLLTVSSYLLQHPATLTADALAAIRSAFAAVVDGVMTVEQVRARHARLFAGERRARKAEGEGRPRARTWSMTIADVYTDGQSGAAGQVARWAHVIRDEMADNPA